MLLLMLMQFILHYCLFFKNGTPYLYAADWFSSTKIMCFIWSLSGSNPNPPDSGICRKLQNKLEVDLLNIAQLKLAQKRWSQAW